MPEQVWNVLTVIFAAGAVYGGIRADLRAMHAEIKSALASAVRAHERIDEILRG